jgi:cell division protein ZapA
VKDKRFRIHIKIDGKPYPLNINREDEERYRRAATKLNETIAEFKKTFRDNDQQDIMAMAAYQIALECMGQHESQDYSQFIDEIKDINDDIADFLKEKK